MLYWIEDTWDNRFKPRLQELVETSASRRRVPFRLPRFSIGRPRAGRIWATSIGISLILIGAEMRTSWLQSWVLSTLAGRLSYAVAPGPSDAIRFPQAGPYNDRLGYSRLPDFNARLKSAGCRIDAQARNSHLAVTLADLGLYPVYPEKTQAGLQILGRDRRPLFSSKYPGRAYATFEAIPPLVVQSLLFIENREILESSYPYRNPSVEWDRLAGAVVDLGLSAVSSHRLSGGSTLATQIEKVRHSPGGRTASVTEKLRQMASASLRAYQGGQETIEARRRIVRDYVNSVPFSAIRGYGEIHGLGDGLWAWYGADFKEVNHLLAGAASSGNIAAKGLACRQALSLLLAINSPSTYLRADPKALEARTDAYLHLLAKEGLISNALRDAALRARAGIRTVAPPRPPVSFADRKGSDPVRVRLLSLLGLESTYVLDRLDLSVRTSLDGPAQDVITHSLQRMTDPAYAAQAGLVGERMIQSGDPSSVIYSFSLYEHSGGVNLLRVQADNYDHPLSINEGTRLELGSTAKLRTLVNYLSIVAGLHREYAPLTTTRLRELAAAKHDRLTAWAIDYLASAPGASLEAMLEAAMSRHYSANPGESFFTGGGLHQFSNFDKKDNGRIMTVSEAFDRSVNLVFIRLMRDIVNYYVRRLPSYSPVIFEDRSLPVRRQYLERFADMEGKQFLAKFHEKYRDQIPDESLELLVMGIHPTPVRLAVIYRSLRPEAGVGEFAAFLRTHLPNPSLRGGAVETLYRKYARDNYSLADRGYLAGVHPLELWLLEYLRHYPGASLAEVFAAGALARQQAYEWLYKTRYKGGQDQRIRIMLEIDAFDAIHKEWKRQGYPFQNLTPSYAAAIGSSGDTPAALAELAGIIMNDGVRYPTVRIQRLHFAAGTPVETILSPSLPAAEKVYPSAVAAVARRAMVGVVERGTGRRAYHSVALPGGRMLEVGGKTGTGDNRFEVYGPGGRPIDSRVLNRTATFVFFFGDRFFGVITAFVPGEKAGQYEFTSALPVQAFKHLAPELIPLVEKHDEALLARR
ncbi:MAG TPA: transglycosylase domain-containing protein [Bryobacteraceae bacterium]|nr:transglycosylase domain-containing protein [Bryobacteraceae bacterium]